tara:strand:- start:633 stop:1250 length:618 start_codon:yes stop_codon:yes gene_type:complete
LKRSRRLVVIGLTGSIAMGKSTAAQMFRDLGVPVFDADAAVHSLMDQNGEAVDAVEQRFPGVTRAGTVDRAALGKRVFGDAEALKALEVILHPLVRRREKQFMAGAHRRRASVVVLDIPLLFETGGQRRCDLTVVVSAPAFLQKMRALKRSGMTPERLNAVLAKQMPDAEKRRRADHVVPTGLGKGYTRRCIAAIVAAARKHGRG